MTKIPANVDFLTSAASSAAKARGVRPNQPTKDSLDIAVALKCINSFQTLEAINELTELDREEAATPLISAARILQSSAESLLSLNAIDTETFNELMLTASIAFAMYGNFPSSKVTLNKIAIEYLFATPVRFLVACVCDPTKDLATQETDPIDGIRGFRYNWFWAIRDESESKRNVHFNVANTLLRSIALKNLSSDQSLCLSLELAMKQAFRLSTASLYQSSPEIPSWFVTSCINNGLVTLLPPQRYLLAEKRLARSTGNDLLTLPTSTGKTLIAEACMAAASNTEGLSIYIAPYVAIGEQVRSSLEVKVGNNIPLKSMFGGFQYSSLLDTNGRALIVMTPERFDAWLRRGEYLEQLRLIVFDEIHIVENGVRGARVEGLISRLRLMQSRMPQLRILGLSAVVSQPSRLCQWLGITNDRLHIISWRPTARRIAICKANGDMHWVHGYDPLRPGNTLPTSPISDMSHIDFPERVVPAMNSAVYEKPASINISVLAMDLFNRLGGPALIVCPRRSDTRLLAQALSDIAEFTPHPDNIMLANKVRSQYNWLSNLATFISRGIAYHNASLPFDVRRDIERATRNRTLNIICSTTTLAEGADLPFRWTLVSHWLAGDGQPLKSMMFRNIAGRNGRAGSFSEGDTILFENRAGHPEAFRGGQAMINSRFNSVMFGSQPIESTAGAGYQILSPDEKGSIKSMFSSQLLACIQENEGADDITSLLSRATYAIHDQSFNNIQPILNESLNSLLNNNEAGGAFAIMNSPIRLTPLGNAANISGFSPDSARAILNYLSQPLLNLSTIDLVERLLIEFNSLGEQQNPLWKKVVSGTGRHPLKLVDIRMILVKISQKEDIRDIFEQLPARRRSTGSAEYVDKQFDAFVSLIDELIFNFLPWLLRAMICLSPFGSQTAQMIDWSQHEENIRSWKI